MRTIEVGWRRRLGFGVFVGAVLWSGLQRRVPCKLVGARRLELPTPTMSKRCRYAPNRLMNKSKRLVSTSAKTSIGTQYKTNSRIGIVNSFIATTAPHHYSPRHLQYDDDLLLIESLLRRGGGRPR